jgi:predicted nucleotidyltransferase component of viral defense system
MPALAEPVSRIFDKVAALNCVTNPVPISANLRAADLLAIAAMKMEVLMRRAAFRDYYDIYSLLKQGVDLGEAVQLALKYSKHQMKRKNLLAILCNGNRFLKSDDFQLLLPVYDVTADEIAAYMSDKINSTFITPPALP